MTLGIAARTLWCVLAGAAFACWLFMLRGGSPGEAGIFIGWAAILLTFPLGWLLMMLSGLLFWLLYVAGFATGASSLVFDASYVLFILASGYFQWFILLPKVRHRLRRR